MTEGDTVIFIVDDDEAIRSGVSMLLTSYGYQVESFAGAHAFLERCDAPLPGSFMVILDLSMPEMNGLELQSALLQRRINVPIVFLSGEGDIPAAVSAMQRGAVDFVEKPVDTDLLLDRITTALEHQRQEHDNTAAGEATLAGLESLTGREREVLDELAGGKTSRAIAQELGISERTVELHRSRILKKVGARNITELLNRVIPILQPRNPAGE